MLWRTRGKIKKWHKGIWPALAFLANPAFWAGAGKAAGGFAGAGGLQGLFGDGDGDEDERGIKRISTLDPNQQNLMEAISGFAEGRIGEGLPAWGGDWTAPVSEQEQFGLGQYREAITGLDPEETQDWYMKYIAPGERRYMEQEIIPGIKESMVPGGTLRSTGTERAIGSAWEQYGTGQLGRIGEAITGERARATGALPGYMQAAGLPRMIAQEELNKEFAEFVRTTPELSPILDLVMDILGVTTQAAFYEPGEEGAGGGILSGLGSMLEGIDFG